MEGEGSHSNRIFLLRRFDRYAKIKERIEKKEFYLSHYILVASVVKECFSKFALVEGKDLQNASHM